MSALKQMMDSPEFNDPNIDISKLLQASKRLSPSVAFAPMEGLSGLMEMQPQGLSLADAWMMKSAGITKEQLVVILGRGFDILKGPPPPQLMPGLLTDHTLQQLEGPDFDVQPIRKLMTLGYSVIYVDRPVTLPSFGVTTPKPASEVNEELNRLDTMGFDIQPLKTLLDKGYILILNKNGLPMTSNLPLSRSLMNQLIEDGFTIIGTKVSPQLPYIGSPSSRALVERPSTKPASNRVVEAIKREDTVINQNPSRPESYSRLPPAPTGYSNLEPVLFSSPVSN